MPVGSDHILVANDETDVLNLYKLGTAQAMKRFDLTDRLQEAGREADIEGATRIEQTGMTYWITSHGRSKEGKMRPDRYRLFGLQPDNQNSTPVRHAGRR